MTMRWTELLFSFRGRIRRLYFWLTTLVFGFAAGMLTSTFQFIAETYGMGETVPDTHQFEPTGPLSIAIFAVTLANLWVNLALSVKRLHDRDRTGWWIAAMYLSIIVAVGLGFLTLTQPEGQREPLNTIAVIAVIAAGVLLIWLVIEIGFLRGTRGPNRFGPDPLADSPGQTPRFPLHLAPSAGAPFGLTKVGTTAACPPREGGNQWI
jgi:uncharacterized membrane protein YhaH (DUF805 family)